MSGNDKLPFGQVAKGLSNNADALLAFGLGLVALALVWSNINAYLACGTPIVLYVLYSARRWQRADSELRAAELEVRKIETTKGRELLTKLEAIKERNISNEQKREAKMRSTQ